MSDLAVEQCYASHLPSLFAAIMATNGSVLEVGAGLWSTPLLRTFCATASRFFCSLESDIAWAEKCGSTHVADADLANILRASACEQWSVVFLDHNGFRRGPDAQLFAASAEYIVVHDWGSEDIMKPFEPFLCLWKHRLVDKRFGPPTLTLTNSDELAERVWIERI